MAESASGMEQVTPTAEQQVSRRGRSVHALLFILIVLSVAYLPVLQGYYAHHDDYYFWTWRRGHFETHPQYGVLLAIGRYVGMPLYLGYGSLIGSVEDVNLVRFISVVNLALAGLVWFHWLRRSGAGWVAAMFVAAMIFTLPPFQVHVAWATCAFVTTGVLLASLAGYVAMQIPADLRLRKLPLSGRALAALALLIASLSTYLTGAMFYWVMAATYLLMRDHEPLSKQKRLLINFSCIGLAAIALNAVIVKLVNVYIVKPKLHPVYNVEAFTRQYLGKLVWFVREPMVNVLNLWEVFPARRVAVVVTLVIASGFALRLLRSTLQVARGRADWRAWPSLAIRAVLLGVLLLLSFLPNLAAATNAAFYRTLLGPAAIVIFLLIWTACQWGVLLPAGWRRPALNCLLAGACIYGVYKAHRNVNDYIAAPAATELRYVKRALREADLAGVTRIHVIRPDRPIAAAQWRYDEFAVPTTAFAQDVPWIVKAAMKEVGRLEQWNYDIVGNGAKGEANVPRDGRTLVIDMAELEGLR